MTCVGGRPIADIHTRLFNSIIKCRKMSKDWEKSAKVLIYKGKGGALQTTNYRGLRMLETPLKVFEKIIFSKLLEHVETKIGQQQRGF